ncbi:uncharacterized protein C8R40DRAFT_1169886 [Lentinula edodes]|uniref:uncharacterized protein n=1 Tax=Lentinula edodes TaxID=5353 RepID=UPI001E8D2A25|nr:uncharacterized protein C8R40DRAFT_1169886 [Lentinula edodes]KAH7876227.1 hypothetical protein C8R40DRAFT_1169886 [Lentinula edodes]
MSVTKRVAEEMDVGLSREVQLHHTFWGSLMQVAYKDNKLATLHPSCGLDPSPNWMNSLGRARIG